MKPFTEHLDDFSKRIEKGFENQDLLLRLIVKKINYISSNQWIPTKEFLPTMFTPVLVSGLHGVTVARRWTGSNQVGPQDQDGWEWLTSNDSVVKDVMHWLPEPSYPIVSEIS